MSTLFFGGLKDGKMKRLPYFGYSLLMGLLMILAIVLLVASVALVSRGFEGVAGIGENGAGRGAVSGYIYLVAIVIAILPFLFASFNMTAKRLRDIGLPGWWTQLSAIGIGFGLSALSVVSPGFLGDIFGLACLLVVFFAPSASLGRGGQ